MRARPLALLVAILLATGCSGASGATAAPPSGQAGQAPGTGAAAPPSVTLPSAAPSAASASVTPAGSAAPAPSVAPAASVVIAYGPFDAQTELIAPSGRRVLIDVTTPEALSRPATERDVLLTTHSHEDHYSREYVDAFPGQTLTMKAGTIEADDIAVTGILGAHDSDPTLSIDNYIFVIDIAGLRVVHLGDLGQDALTPAQLAAIGKVDVLVAQLSNSFSSMTVENRKGFNLVNQVHPRLLIVTHMLEDTVGTAKAAAAEWPAFYTTRRWITVTPATLPATTTVLFMGEEAAALGRITNAQPATW